MAPWTAKGSSDAEQKEAQDLGSLMSSEERTDFTLLVANITERMLKQISDTFDASITSADSSKPALRTLKSNPNIDKSAHHEETEEEEKARKLLERREKDLSAPKLQELKKAAIDYCHEWQESVVLRIGEVVNSKDTAERQIAEVKEVGSASPAPPPVQHSISTITEISKDSKDDNIEEQEDPDETLIRLYPPTSTALCGLPKNKRVLVLHSMLLLLLSLKHYVAHSRVLLLHMASSLHLPLHFLAEDEVEIAKTLAEAAKHMSGDEEAEKRGKENKTARMWKVGLAGVAGAAIIGVTGGLAAPLVAAGIGAVMGGLGLGATAAAGMLGALAESGLVVGALFGAYGASMTGKMMDEYAKEVEDFAFLPLRSSKHFWKGAKEVPAEDRRLRVTIGVSGWITQKEDIINPWRALGHQSEIFALRWELKALLNLGTSIESVVKNAAWGMAKKQIIARTIFASLTEAMWPLAVLKARKIIDNPFSVAMVRADKAGLVLADAIINKAQGERPITLIGYSLGARVIYSCLMSLAERRAFGLIESAVLIGTPAPSDAGVWRMIKSVVAGRLVNVFSRNDYILAFLYRTSNIQLGVAGVEEVDAVYGVENVDVSELVSGHLRYQYLVGVILEKIGWEDVDLEEVDKETETIALLDEEERKAVEKVEDGDVETDGKEKKEHNLLQAAAAKLHIG